MPLFRYAFVNFHGNLQDNRGVFLGLWGLGCENI